MFLEFKGMFPVGFFRRFFVQVLQNPKTLAAKKVYILWRGLKGSEELERRMFLEFKGIFPVGFL
jgi:hypothetical protein